MEFIKRITSLVLAFLLVMSFSTIQASAAKRYEGDELANADVGDVVVFGAYEQDDNEFNGKEPIEWIVLEKQDGKLLVVSKYALAAKRYNTRSTNITWADCSLREWLNETFLEEAFSETEQDQIPTVSVSADKNPNYKKRDPGVKAKDQIFLLSVKEVKRYFGSNASRQCKPTAYARAQGCYVKAGCCWWWTRTPGDRGIKAAAIKNNGDINYKGYTVHCGGTAEDHSLGGVRPAMWIEISDLE